MNMKVLVTVLTLLWFLAPDRVAWSGPPSDVLTVPGFGQVSLYAPPTLPSQVVLFVSGDGGWNLGVIPMAEALRDRGALVIGIDIRTFLKSLNAADSCAYPPGDLERLSRTVQLKRGLPEYQSAVLVGYSSGATWCYAALAAAPSETFAAAISLGFCPDLEIRRPLCSRMASRPRIERKDSASMWRPITKCKDRGWCCQGERRSGMRTAVTRAFAADVPGTRLFSCRRGHGFAVAQVGDQYLEATKRSLPHAASSGELSTAPEIRDLTLAEIPVPLGARTDTMAIIITGDGGGPDLDKQSRNRNGCSRDSLRGWSSLRYYWTREHQRAPPRT